MADPIFVFTREELVILLLAAILIGAIYGVIDKRRGKFKKPQSEETSPSEE